MSETTNSVVWFEIPVMDMASGRAFYEAVFDLDLTVIEMGTMQMAMFPMKQDVDGASGALVKGKDVVPSHAGTHVYFSVNDIESTLAKVNANGGKTLVQKTDIEQYGFFAHFEDSEGNLIGLHSMK